MEIEKSIVVNALEAAGAEEDDLRTSYSGRYMYGTSCFGIVGRPATLCRFFVALVIAVAGNDDTDVFVERIDLCDDLADALVSDNIGLDMIYYFPGFTLV